MKRRNEGGRVSHIQINYSGPSFFHLPNNILVTILLRLSVKWIFVCKCVCKSWYDLISDPEFAKLHCNQAQVCPLLRISGFTCQSRMLYLVQPELDDFERKLHMCYDSSPIEIKLDSKLKLPLINIEMILDKQGLENKNCINMDMKKHVCNIVNSCNGLLCLSNPYDDDPVIVCNPVTGEFINLPEVRTRVNGNPEMFRTKCGFYFSPETNNYKVIRIFTDEEDRVMVAEVHILGTKTWRALPSLPKSTYMDFPTYLNGCVYWFSDQRPLSPDSQPLCVICFNIEKECFESISVPPLRDDVLLLSMGVLRGELFISAYGFCDTCFWAMKDNGAKKSWSLILTFDDEKKLNGTYKPITYLNNGALLMFHPGGDTLIYKDPRKTGLRYSKVRGCKSVDEAIAYIPSFVPLKHALSGHDVKVLNVNSRCA